MHIENYEFKEWMQKLLDKLEEVGKGVRSLQNNPEVMPGDKLLDNQDLYLLFRVSTRTLQRLRAKKKLPFMMISGKGFRCKGSGSVWVHSESSRKNTERIGNWAIPK